MGYREGDVAVTGVALCDVSGAEIVIKPHCQVHVNESVSHTMARNTYLVI